MKSCPYCGSSYVTDQLEVEQEEREARASIELEELEVYNVLLINTIKALLDVINKQEHQSKRCYDNMSGCFCWKKEAIDIINKVRLK